MDVFNYIMQNLPEIGMRTVQHIQLTLISITAAILIGVPLGILISYIGFLRKPILAIANIVQAVPSIALLGFLVPIIGIGEKPAIFMVFLYSQLPIIKNTVTGLSNINAETLEAAKGIGMNNFQILARVRFPLALPVIMAGVRISAVTSVGLVTLSAFVGAGGLGYLIYSGIRTVNNGLILSGAIPACTLALLVDWLGGAVENFATPACLKDEKID